MQLCVDIASHIISQTDATSPTTMSESFTVLADLKIISSVLASKLVKATGFRNVAIHNYEVINWAIVYSICHQQLETAKAAICYPTFTRPSSAT